MKSIKNSKGFTALQVLLVLVVLGTIGGTGYYVYNSQKETNKLLDNSDAKAPVVSKGNDKPAVKDKHPDWITYTNTNYGFSYKYPTTWTTSDESSLDSSQSASKQEFVTGLRLTEVRKYNNTVVTEVLNQSLRSAENWYDNSYAQSSQNVVSKSNITVGSKNAVAYIVKNTGQESRLYLIEVGNKTYSFASINEQANLLTDANYWSTFNDVFESFTIN